jgi:arylsulfatase
VAVVVNRRLPLSISLALATGCGSEQAAELVSAGDDPELVVLIVVDTLRKDRLSCYGNERLTSPHIDALAAAGLRFDQAVSQAPWTTPSIGSLLTSRYPSELGIVDESSVLPRKEETLAEALQERGIATAAVVSHSFCSARWQFNQGFDRFDESNIKGHQGASSPGVTDRAIEILEQHPGGPLFLFLHYFDPHYAYEEQSDFAFGGRGDYSGRIRSAMGFRVLRKLASKIRPADLTELLRLYDSEVAFTDHHIGRFLERMQQLGLYEDALICFTADHGEEFLDHDDLGHTRTLYAEVLNVPLILKVPGTLPGVRTEPVALLDVFPTILDLLGLPQSKGLAGQSMVARPLGKGPPVFSETSRWAHLQSMVAGSYKLIHNLDVDQVQVFDLQRDPTEQQPVETHDLNEVPGMLHLLQTWRANLNIPDQQKIDLSEEDRERLEALGYAE